MLAHVQDAKGSHCLSAAAVANVLKDTEETYSLVAVGAGSIHVQAA